MNQPIRVGLLTGAGGAHLSAYFAALRETEGVSAVSVFDASGSNFDAARTALGDKLTATYRNLGELLGQERPALALVSVEAAAAPPIIDAALEANCHVFAEKPSCVAAADFEKLAGKADSKHRLLMLALANRVHPVIQAARELIRTGALGGVYGIELHVIADQTRLKSPAYHKQWFAQKSRAGGGNLIWLGIHWLDLAMFVTGSKIEEVAGFAGNVGGQPIDVEDSAVMALRFDNGAFGTLTSGYYLDKGYHSHLKVWGSHGWLQVSLHGGEPLVSYSTKAEPREVKVYSGPREPSGYTPFVQAAVKAAAGLADPPVTAAESLHVVRTVFACYEAAKTGQSQKVGA